jgi:hypothetical protein
VLFVFLRGEFASLIGDALDAVLETGLAEVDE